jgi:hypothetical protein
VAELLALSAFELLALIGAADGQKLSAARGDAWKLSSAVAVRKLDPRPLWRWYKTATRI